MFIPIQPFFTGSAPRDFRGSVLKLRPELNPNRNKLLFIYVSHFHPSLIFEGNAGAYHCGLYLKGAALALLTKSSTLGGKSLTVTDKNPQIMPIKGFILQAPSGQAF
jgi:hypothetical protein